MKKNKFHQWHENHNKKVAEFHKDHEQKIQHGINGDSLLAKWERFFYHRIIVPLKNN